MFQYRLIMRPRPTPSPTVALGVRSVGRYALSLPIEPWQAGGPAAKHFAEIFWCVRGHGWHVIEGVKYAMTPGDIAVYMPGMLQRYAPDIDAEMEYCLFTMDGPLARTIIEGMGLYPGVHHVGPAPEELFEKLERTIIDPSPEGERLASAIGYELLARAHGTMDTELIDPLVRTVLRHLHKVWNQANLSVADLAAEHRVHRSTLCRRFQAALGMSPADYILKLRLQSAGTLLHETALTVAEIARQCGYDDPNYFCRLFKRKNGMTPKQYRKTKT